MALEKADNKPTDSELCAKVKELIAVRKLPARSVGAEVNDASSRAKRLDYCRLCGGSFQHGEIWYRLIDPANPPDASHPDPELHLRCYAAWNVEVNATPEA